MRIWHFPKQQDFCWCWHLLENGMYHSSRVRLVRCLRGPPGATSHPRNRRWKPNDCGSIGGCWRWRRRDAYCSQSPDNRSDRSMIRLDAPSILSENKHNEGNVEWFRHTQVICKLGREFCLHLVNEYFQRCLCN